MSINATNCIITVAGREVHSQPRVSCQFICACGSPHALKGPPPKRRPVLPRSAITQESDSDESPLAIAAKQPLAVKAVIVNPPTRRPSSDDQQLNRIAKEKPLPAKRARQAIVQGDDEHDWDSDGEKNDEDEFDARQGDDSEDSFRPSDEEEDDDDTGIVSQVEVCEQSDIFQSLTLTLVYAACSLESRIKPN